MIDKTAIIDKAANIDSSVCIGPNTIIGADVAIKANVIIGPNCVIDHCQIDEGCKISCGVVLGGDPQDLSYKDEPSKVYIGSQTVLREFVTINRGTAKTLKTVIGKNCFFMAYTHAAHDDVVGDNVILANYAALGGHVEVGSNVFLGGHVGVHQFCKIGRGVMAAAGTIVTMDIVPFAMCGGYRAVIEGLNIVGMRRLKMAAADIAQIKHIYKILFSQGLLLKDAVGEIEKLDSPFAKEILEFIKRSGRALARPK
ncbi:MAG: acyl-ACP--UDP-N-acetylglucosamine O-acyltransferase [Elusimicrobiota bacterium]|jgi:UDP-N-acetylglucosamine acyltransferase|nr:acyl-ACP--UDP-N-acetylglucosamine O-acyltransferase [Elusimicrobiota bacterium]